LVQPPERSAMKERLVGLRRVWRYQNSNPAKKTSHQNQDHYKLTRIKQLRKQSFKISPHTVAWPFRDINEFSGMWTWYEI